ncbi:Sir2 family NAD-dependent protein deacetylase [Subtercola boreus]|uniref:protein acetyllysine N-acetyltransferase n=1 Tax=Subtercola boreus TaxID=120213 RepID=A0A3E0WAW8_9MICO|nr:Sir2 family NAD-dependent protein deacetylase [Subtercola boreus]RFA21227.1 NAD-dependent deacetylase [Subtercola boreus]RFA21610.1 NAD-dependent deacetylase [Subtercola boreus]RFA27579.1 NAD-dependent deacetylase [Subtercola boreus]
MALMESERGGTGILNLDEVVDVLRGKRTVVLTGAGLSTDSGIPDYRGEGAPKRNPMTFDQFLGNADYRKRYWAGSHLGWKLFDAARPNTGHAVLADLEKRGFVSGIVTQNVDGLHVRAGSTHVVDLHGSVDRVRCLTCGQMFARVSVADTIDRANPWITRPDAVTINPDGDAEVSDWADFEVPVCTVCGGILKPDVVFFGEYIPKERFSEATALVRASEALIIAGSSLVVNSGIRLLEQARRRRLPIVIINRGVTKGDSRATVKLDAGTSETLTALAARLVS